MDDYKMLNLLNSHLRDLVEFFPDEIETAEALAQALNILRSSD